jgi:hypothetical protein
MRKSRPLTLSELLSHFIRDVRHDLDAPKLPFVIGVMGVGGLKDEYLKKYEADLISSAETALWKRGASNAGYHYLACAKTFAPDGPGIR